MVPYSKHQGNGHQAPTSSVEDALAAIRRGEIVIVADDPGRENEGDFVMAAERVTPDAINFMVTHGRGIVCLPVTRERAGELGFAPMVPDQSDERGCAFTVSVDLRHPPNTGTSTFDRAACMARVVSPDARPHDFRAPGHVFPLEARPGGVLERPGHTEAAVDLARLAGLAPAGVICEILNSDGSPRLASPPPRARSPAWPTAPRSTRSSTWPWSSAIPGTPLGCSSDCTPNA